MNYGYETDDYEPSEQYPDDAFCEYCGRNLNEDVKGCPECNSCGGIYAPGTEECDWCEYSGECSEIYSHVD